MGIIKEAEKSVLSVSDHLEELKKKHAMLGMEVEAMQQESASEAFDLSELKKQKLKLKEEIERLSTDSGADQQPKEGNNNSELISLQLKLLSKNAKLVSNSIDETTKLVRDNVSAAIKAING